MTRVRVRWVGHQLFAEIHATAKQSASAEGTHRLVRAIDDVLRQAIPHLGETTIQIEWGEPSKTATPLTLAGLDILPSRYQLAIPSAAPMGASSMQKVQSHRTTSGRTSAIWR